MRNIDSTTPNKIATKVTTLDFLGSFCRAHLKPDAAPNVAILADFSLNLMRDLSVAEGQALTVALPPESLRVFANMSVAAIPTPKRAAFGAGISRDEWLMRDRHRAPQQYVALRDAATGHRIATVLVKEKVLRMPDTLPNVNDKVYIHEFIDIIGHNRVNYMHHMTANWSPIAQEERRQLCYGVWAVIGTTREWPQVVNLWEEDGFKGLSQSLDRECNNPSVQDPKLAKWWAEAANYRSRGVDRVLVPAPWTRTIEELCAEGVRGALYADEQFQLPQGTSASFLDAVREEALEPFSEFGWELAGAWETAMVNESECFLLWSIPTFEQWGEVEAAQRSDTGLARWRKRTYDLSTHQHRFLLVDSPLSPMRTGRQPSRDDREPGWDDL